MKKPAAVFLSVIMLAAAIFAFTACSHNYVDIRGNYMTATKEEVAAALADVQEYSDATFDIYLHFEIYQNYDSIMYFEIDGRMSFIDNEIKMNVSYEMEALNGSESYDIYADNDYVYMNDGANKVKARYSGDPTANIIPGVSTSLSDVFEELRSDELSYDLSIAENGDVTKIKIQLNLYDMDLGFEKISYNMPAEMYLIIENDRITAFAAKCDFSHEMVNAIYSFNVDMQCKSTDEAVALPSDLDTYSTSFA